MPHELVTMLRTKNDAETVQLAAWLAHACHVLDRHGLIYVMPADALNWWREQHETERLDVCSGT